MFYLFEPDPENKNFGNHRPLRPRRPGGGGDVDVKYVPPNSRKLIGLVLVDVDDLLCGGGPEHHARMDQLKTRFKFGKWESCTSTSGAGFIGRRVRQYEDFSFTIDMEKFVSERLQELRLGRLYRPGEPLDEDDVARLRGAVGALNWVQREGRPDVAGDCAMLMQGFPHPTWEHAKEAQRIIRYLKDTNVGTMVKIWSIPLEKATWFVTSDASFGNAKRGGSQGGYLIGLSSENLVIGKISPVSFITWKSHRLPRVNESTLAAESQSLVEALGELEWLRIFWAEAQGWSDTFQWLTPQFDKCVVHLRRGAFESIDGKCNLVCTTDAKSLFDHLAKESAGTTKDKRSAITMSAIRDFLERHQGVIKWIPGEAMIADPLTKQNGHRETLLNVMRCGKYGITENAWRELKNLITGENLISIMPKSTRGQGSTERATVSENASLKKRVHFSQSLAEVWWFPSSQ
jgi:hypothetical protein